MAIQPLKTTLITIKIYSIGKLLKKLSHWKILMIFDIYDQGVKVHLSEISSFSKSWILKSGLKVKFLYMYRKKKKKNAATTRAIPAVFDYYNKSIWCSFLITYIILFVCSILFEPRVVSINRYQIFCKN